MIGWKEEKDKQKEREKNYSGQVMIMVAAYLSVITVKVAASKTLDVGVAEDRLGYFPVHGVTI